MVVVKCVRNSYIDSESQYCVNSMGVLINKSIQLNEGRVNSINWVEYFNILKELVHVHYEPILVVYTEICIDEDPLFYGEVD